jgi:hypothetical protein
MVRNAAGCACCLLRPNFPFRNVGLVLRIVVADGRRKFLMFLDKIVVVRLVKNFTTPPFYYDVRKNTLHNVTYRTSPHRRFITMFVRTHYITSSQESCIFCACWNFGKMCFYIILFPFVPRSSRLSFRILKGFPSKFRMYFSSVLSTAL